MWTQKKNNEAKRRSMRESSGSQRAKRLLSVKVMRRPRNMSNNTLHIVSTDTSFILKRFRTLECQSNTNAAWAEGKSRRLRSVLSNESLVSNKPNNQWTCISYIYIGGCFTAVHGHFGRSAFTEGIIGFYELMISLVLNKINQILQMRSAVFLCGR